MAGTTALVATSLAATALSSAVGVYSSIQQGKAQSEQARYQAEIARQNRDLAEQQASAERRQGYENMIARRQDTARLIAKQRAAAGASGAVVDVGSNLDLQADTAFQGELDAISLYNKGIDAGYNAEIQAMQYGQQADAYDATASQYQSAGYLNAASAALGGIAEIGSTWAGYAGRSSGNGTQGVYNAAPLNNALSGRSTGQWRLNSNIGNSFRLKGF
jgi:hypothetical protein